MRDRAEWILAFILVYGLTFVSIVGTIFTCRGIYSLFVM